MTRRAGTATALEFLGGDLAKAERSARAAHQAPLPLAGYPLFYVVSALALQGEVDESEAALSFGVPSIEGVSLMLLAKGDEVERIVRLEEATALLEGTRRRRVSPTPWSSSAVRCGARVAALMPANCCGAAWTSRIAAAPDR